MVIKTETCRFSGLRIYPGHGMTMVRVDSQIFKFLNAKIKVNGKSKYLGTFVDEDDAGGVGG